METTTFECHGNFVALGSVVNVRYLDQHRHIKVISGLVSAIGDSFACVVVSAPATWRELEMTIQRQPDGRYCMFMSDRNYGRCFEKGDDQA